MSLTIRRANANDAAAFARIMGDPEVYPGVLQLPYPDEAGWRTRLAEAVAPGKADLSLVAERAGEVVGNAGVFAVGPALRRRHAMGLGICVAGNAQGQGVGTALMRALTDYADQWAQVLRLELTVYTDNAAAIALYRRSGFQIEGTHRAFALRDGVYVDAHFMARLHPRPPQLPAVAA